MNQRPAASEIILNPDHSIYHLNLRNGEVPQKVITVGDPDRVSMVSKYFDEIYWRRSSREFVMHRGRIGSEEIMVLSTGIGTDNIDVALTELQLAYAWDLPARQAMENPPPPLQIIRLGTSGSLREDIPVDSILISEAALGYDGLMHFYEHDLPWVEAHPDLPKGYLAPAGEQLLEAFKALSPYRGLTLTASGFYGPQGRNIIVPARPAGLLQTLIAKPIQGMRLTNLEMETAGIYALSHLFGAQALSISAILANRLEGRFSKKPEQTVRAMIEKSLEIFSELH